MQKELIKSIPANEIKAGMFVVPPRIGYLEKVTSVEVEWPKKIRIHCGWLSFVVKEKNLIKTYWDKESKNTI